MPRPITVADAAIAIGGDLAGFDKSLEVARTKSLTLGGRDWIEHHATAREVFEAFKVVVREAFPLEDSALGSYPALVGMLLKAAGERMDQPTEESDQPPAPESSTSTSLPTGTASPKRSTRR